MKTPIGTLCVALLLLLPGCSPQDRQQAEHLGSEAQTKTSQAAHTATRDLDEGTLTLRVKTALASSEQLKGANISVSTDAQMVKLTGTVVTEAQKETADRIASDTVGSKLRVTDKLTIEKRAAKR